MLAQKEYHIWPALAQFAEHTPQSHAGDRVTLGYAHIVKLDHNLRQRDGTILRTLERRRRNYTTFTWKMEARWWSLVAS
jgi:hypothetical protein